MVRSFCARRRIATVDPGTLVVWAGLGIEVNADYNDPEHGRQPYLTIVTHRMDERFAGDRHGPNMAISLNDATLHDWPPRSPTAARGGGQHLEALARELVDVVVALRVFAPERRGDLSPEAARELRDRGRALEAELVAERSEEDPGEDIFTGVATGFGTPHERAAWAAARHRATTSPIEGDERVV